MYNTTTYSSPLGRLTLACTDGQLSGLWMENQKYFGGSILTTAIANDQLTIFKETKQWLDVYFKGENPDPSKLALAPAGTAFQLRVWEILGRIPYGEVITYKEIAKKIAVSLNRETMSSQAVGGAVAHNPISIIIPCHRVVGTNGSLTGYAGGIERKRRLLELEGLDLNNISLLSSRS